MIARRVLCLLMVCGLLATPCAPAATLYVARRGWHIDIGFAADELSAPLEAVVAELPGARTIFFGFGDRRYLLARHHWVPQLFEAVWPGEGIVLATGLTATPAAAFGASHVVMLRVSDDALALAQHMVWKTLSASQAAQMGSGHAGLPGPYAGSLYLGSGSTYSGAHTCNTWAAEVLRSARLPVRSRGVVFAGQLWSQLQPAE